MSKKAAPRRYAETEASAYARALKVSARKLNLVAQSIRGKDAALALHELAFSPRRIARDVNCLIAMPLLALALKGKPPAIADSVPGSAAHTRSAPPDPERPLGFSPNALQTLLCIAGVSCCVAMSMPQVHMVAYCGDLGYPAARGAEMLSLMLGFGIVSRLVSGWVADRIGGLRTLLLGAALQAVALALFLPFQQLAALYVISALFGLFQGGLVPSYPIVVREYFSPREAGVRTGTVLMATLFGMALGGWLPGWIFDLTGSYRAAFANGIAWNLVTTTIALLLLSRARRLRVRTA